MLRSLEDFLFQMNRDYSGNSIDLILVDKCPVCYQIMEKKKEYGQWTLLMVFNVFKRIVEWRFLPFYLGISLASFLLPFDVFDVY